MSRILLSAAALSGMAVAAAAADLPVHKAPLFSPQPVHQWEGFSVGGHAGYTWTHTDSDTSSTVTGALLGSATNNVSGFQGGLQAGYDHMLSPRWLVGLRAEFSYNDLTLDQTISNAAGTNVHRAVGKTRWSGAVLGRVGYSFGSWMVYGLGGWSWADATSTRTQQIGTTGLAGPGTLEEVSMIRNGWTLGLGAEVMLKLHWSVFGEYRYIGYGTDQIVFPLAQQASSARGDASLVQGGFNYRF